MRSLILSLLTLAITACTGAEPGTDGDTDIQATRIQGAWRGEWFVDDCYGSMAAWTGGEDRTGPWSAYGNCRDGDAVEVATITFVEDDAVYMTLERTRLERVGDVVLPFDLSDLVLELTLEGDTLLGTPVDTDVDAGAELTPAQF